MESMESTANAQRRRAHRKPADSCLIHIDMKDGMGNPRWVQANLVDVFGDGCGLALMTRLNSGSTVTVRGKLGQDRAADYRKAEVRWCVANTDGTCRAGLKFLDEPANSINPVTPDYYELMQLSPTAAAETISRVYRMLAFRYHPDNTETGNHEMFLRLSEAHEILSDPEKRANYDLRRRDTKRLYGKNLDQASAPTEKRANLDVVTSAYLGVNSLGWNARWEG
jgi:hypothetical protein